MKIRKIYNEIQLIWNEKTNSYDTIYEDSYYHDGEIYQMAKGEIDMSGSESAKKALDKVSRAAKKVTDNFTGANKVTKENVAIIKLLAKETDSLDNNVTALVKAYKDKIEAMLRVKAVTDSEKKDKKELAAAEKRLAQAQRDRVRILKANIEAEKKLKALNIKEYFKAETKTLKQNAQASKEREAILKRQAQARKKVSAQLSGLHSKLKKHNVSLKDVTQGTNLAARAMRGEAKALQEIKRRTEEVIRTGKLNGKQLKLFETRSNRNAMSLSRLRSQLLMAAFAFGMMKKIVSFATEAFIKQEKAEAMVTSALKATSGAVGLSNTAIYEHAAALQKATGVGDEMILSSSALLLTFRKIGGEEFKQAQSSIVDLTLALNQGTISEEKMKSSTIMLGKALNDPIKGMTALSRAGVTFDETQKQQIRTLMELGDVQGAQGIILQELENQVGGLGEAFGKTTEGKIMAMKSAFGDLQEAAGAVLIPVIKVLIDMLTVLIKLFGSKHTWYFITALTIASARTYMLANGLKAATIWQNFYTAATVKATAATGSLTLAIKTLKRATIILAVLEVGIWGIGKAWGGIKSIVKGIGRALGFGSDKAKENTKQVNQLTEAEQKLHDAAVKRNKDIEDNIWALKKEIRVLKEKSEIGKWIIQQEKIEEGVLYLVTEAEIALKKEIIAINKAQKESVKNEKKRLAIVKIYIKSSKELLKSTMNLIKAEIKYADILGKAYDKIDLSKFDQDIIDRIKSKKENTLDLVRTQELRNDLEKKLIDTGYKAIYVDGQAKLVQEKVILGQAKLAINYIKTYTKGLKTLEILEKIVQEQEKIALMEEGRAFAESIDKGNIALQKQVDLLKFKYNIEKISFKDSSKFPDAVFKLKTKDDKHTLLPAPSEYDIAKFQLREAYVVKNTELQLKAIESQAKLTKYAETTVGYDGDHHAMLEEANIKANESVLINKENYYLNLKGLKIDQKKLDEQEKLNKQKEIETEIMNLKVAIGQEVLGIISQQIEARAELLNAEMQADIERIKLTSEYKLASMRKDKTAMDKMEDDARKKTLPARKQAFRQKQMVALAEIGISTAVAIMKAHETGPVYGAAVTPYLIALASLQAAGVLSQKGPKFALGGDFVTSGRQNITVGDNPGGRERVQITPLSSPNVNGPSSKQTINVTFTGNVMSEDFIENQAIPQIKDAIRRGADIGIS